MTRSENMRRLWADAGFRKRAVERMSALARRMWASPGHREQASERAREVNRRRSRERNERRPIT